MTQIPIETIDLIPTAQRYAILIKRENAMHFTLLIECPVRMSQAEIAIRERVNEYDEFAIVPWRRFSRHYSDINCITFGRFDKDDLVRFKRNQKTSIY